MSSYEQYCLDAFVKFQEEIKSNNYNFPKLLSLLLEYSSIIEKRRKSHCLADECNENNCCNEKIVEYRYNEICSELIFNTYK